MKRRAGATNRSIRCCLRTRRTLSYRHETPHRIPRTRRRRSAGARPEHIPWRRRPHRRLPGRRSGPVQRRQMGVQDGRAHRDVARDRGWRRLHRKHERPRARDRPGDRRGEMEVQVADADRLLARDRRRHAVLRLERRLARGARRRNRPAEVGVRRRVRAEIRSEGPARLSVRMRRPFPTPGMSTPRRRPSRTARCTSAPATAMSTRSMRRAASCSGSSRPATSFMPRRRSPAARCSSAAGTGLSTRSTPSPARRNGRSRPAWIP